ncbi:hypothetical protein N7468_001759 [Penicillium chermesinum]|uniref:Uncharacterized protein n=1 Tax=Penicillium chermesinum TaxID=63820 RepID=A0A9W9PIV7_9EURO|nr:uncharacterized protein N7468_001759 [Penicillium chermesinum]KAJ5246776.1 hypothetical protein N7468_001759 [Penicillium chermesinum]KAJ6145041.1 hypothetical protein N7470_008936 [Penicillium chermesinum]
MPVPPQLEYSFTLHVDLDHPLDFGSTVFGDRRFIPISGGSVSGPKLNGKIIPNSGGDWNTVRSDDVVHLYARYSIQADDGSMIGIINEGYGRDSQKAMKSVFEDADPSSTSMANGGKDWYTRTSPRFELATENKKFQWLISSVFLGDLKPPTRPGYVEIDVYRVL